MINVQFYDQADNNDVPEWRKKMHIGTAIAAGKAGLQ